MYAVWPIFKFDALEFYVIYVDYIQLIYRYILFISYALHVLPVGYLWTGGPQEAQLTETWNIVSTLTLRSETTNYRYFVKFVCI